MSLYDEFRKDEQIILIIRRHWWYFIKLFFQLIAIALILIACFVFLGFNSISFLVLILVIIIALLLSLYYWFLWKNDVYILTDQRIIDINRNNIFNKEVIEFTLDKVQDVYYQQHGPIPMLVNFGEVVIETAGEQKNVKIELAPNPAHIQKKISELLQQWRRKRSLSPESGNKDINNMRVSK